ncbi:uncharacterized protein LOC144767544 [Lissotriton helveticus]
MDRFRLLVVPRDIIIRYVVGFPGRKRMLLGLPMKLCNPPVSVKSEQELEVKQMSAVVPFSSTVCPDEGVALDPAKHRNARWRLKLFLLFCHLVSVLRETM